MFAALLLLLAPAALSTPQQFTGRVYGAHHPSHQPSQRDAACPPGRHIYGVQGAHLTPGPLFTHLHTVYMAYSERHPTRLNPLG
jgi:hypothetical protein